LRHGHDHERAEQEGKGNGTTVDRRTTVNHLPPSHSSRRIVSAWCSSRQWERQTKSGYFANAAAGGCGSLPHPRAIRTRNAHAILLQQLFCLNFQLISRRLKFFKTQTGHRIE
jgi:hypothetical protein